MIKRLLHFLCDTGIGNGDRLQTVFVSSPNDNKTWNLHSKFALIITTPGKSGRYNNNCVYRYQSTQRFSPKTPLCIVSQSRGPFWSSVISPFMYLCDKNMVSRTNRDIKPFNFLSHGQKMTELNDHRLVEVRTINSSFFS